MLSTSQGRSKPQTGQAAGRGSKNMNLNPTQVCVQLPNLLLWTLELVQPTSPGCWRTRDKTCAISLAWPGDSQYRSHMWKLYKDWRGFCKACHWIAGTRALWFLGWRPLLTSSSHPSPGPWVRMWVPWCPRAAASRENYSPDTLLLPWPGTEGSCASKVLKDAEPHAWKRNTPGRWNQTGTDWNPESIS